MKPHSWGFKATNAQATPQPIKHLWFYFLGLEGLTDTQIVILQTIVQCYHNRDPCQPSLPTWARWFGRSRSKVLLAIRDLEQKQWIVVDWRGGRKSNVYSPGPRLWRVLRRHEGGTNGKVRPRFGTGGG
jgi:hypothetical protein